MKDEVVKLDLAKLIKSKGFDEYTPASYVGGELVNYMGWKNSYKLTDPVHQFPNHGKEAKPMISAPTLNILQRWLREKHNLHIEVKVQDSIKEVKYYWSIFGPISENYIRCLENSPIEDYTSYEIALESALEAAIKLIK